MDDKNHENAEMNQEEQERQNIENRQHFESASQGEEQENSTKEATNDGSRDFIHMHMRENNPGLFSHKNGGTASAAAVISRSHRIFLVLSWVSAAFTAFVSAYFAIPGILFGALANRISRGSGNAAIITNIVLAIVNLLFGLFLVYVLRRVFV